LWEFSAHTSVFAAMRGVADLRSLLVCSLGCALMTIVCPRLEAAEPGKVLLPRGSGHQFVCYGDCCSGIPGQLPSEVNFAAVNAVVGSLSPEPEFVCFVGDHIAGLTTDYDELRREWRYWLDHEMAWLDKSVPVYHVTSNHNTYDGASEAVWREVFPDIPKNGPPGQEGLSYWVRKGDLLLVFANTNFSGLGCGRVEHQWLDEVLAKNQDAHYRLIFGHQPIFPVNGYDRHNWWIVQPSDGKAFWEVLVRHNVTAYICSHIIAFDVQVHKGVLQITTGGAGTEHGPGGFMPGQTEYFHAVQMAIDQLGLRYQVLDTNGTRREWLTWPIEIPPVDSWQPFTADVARALAGKRYKEPEHNILCWRFAGTAAQDAGIESQTLLSGWEGLVTFWIGIEGAAPRLTVRLVPEPGGGTEVWTGPVVERGRPFDVRVAIHSGMGPGGILWRTSDSEGWNSMVSSSSRGAATMAWPYEWTVGHVFGTDDRPFAGRDLQITWIEHRCGEMQAL